MPFWQFLRIWLIGWIGHALLVQPSISAHRKWPEMVVSASTNQVWTKNTFSRNGLWFGYSERGTSSVSEVTFTLNYLRMICILCQIIRQKVKGSIKESKCWHQISGTLFTSTYISIVQTFSGVLEIVFN